MGSLGFISRFVGCIFGSDMTFASGVNESAPGQMPMKIEGLLKLLYKVISISISSSMLIIRIGSIIFKQILLNYPPCNYYISIQY